MSLIFSDGMEFDTNTEFHIEKRSDGFYVVGNGILIPVNDEEEGEKIIKKLKK